MADDLVSEVLENFRETRAQHERTKELFARGIMSPRNIGALGRLQTVEDWTRQLDQWVSELNEAIAILEAAPHAARPAHIEADPDQIR